MKNIIAYRLKLIRRIRGLSMDALVNRMGDNISKMAISKYERAVIQPSAKILELIAKACGVDVSYFYRQPVDIGKTSFRFYKDQPADVASTVMQQIQVLLDEYVEAENIIGASLPFDNPLKSMEIREDNDIEIAVAQLRKEWQLGMQPIVSVYELLQMHGVRVVEFSYEDAKVNGLSLYVNGKIPFALINTFANTTVERKRFTALHELGHLLMDIHIDEENPESYKIIEKMANHFAGAMLLPAEVARKRMGDERNDIRLAEFISMKNLYGISVASQNYRFYDLGIITYEYRNHIFNEIIHPNQMEKGWGGFPVPETADRLSLIEERLKIKS